MVPRPADAFITTDGPDQAGVTIMQKFIYSCLLPLPGVQAFPNDIEKEGIGE
jgi:hypothetical protein